jgi:hypothetical protein
MSLIKLFLGGKNLVFSRPERVWSVTSRLETGKWLTPFNSVGSLLPFVQRKNTKFPGAIGNQQLPNLFFTPLPTPAALHVLKNRR